MNNPVKKLVSQAKALVTPTIKRAKSIEFVGDADFLSTVSAAAISLTNFNMVDCKMLTDANMVKMRKLLVPAYKAIALKLSDALKIKDLKESSLSGLTIELNPTLGVWSFKINYTSKDGNVQPYKVTVTASDKKNTYLRTLLKTDSVDLHVTVFDSHSKI